MKHRFIRFDKETVGIVLSDAFTGNGHYVTWVDISDGVIRTQPVTGDFTIVKSLFVSTKTDTRWEVVNQKTDSLGRIILFGAEGQWAYVGGVTVC
jgi:hypothetical protein